MSQYIILWLKIIRCGLLLVQWKNQYTQSIIWDLSKDCHGLKATLYVVCFICFVLFALVSCLLSPLASIFILSGMHWINGHLKFQMNGSHILSPVYRLCIVILAGDLNWILFLAQTGHGWEGYERRGGRKKGMVWFNFTRAAAFQFALHDFQLPRVLLRLHFAHGTSEFITHLRRDQLNIAH